MKTFDDVIRVFEENEDLCDFVGKIGVRAVEEAESVLGINFPISYRHFLCEYGAGDFGAQEIYGIVSDDLDVSGIPNAIWLTQKEREESNLPNELIIVSYSGDETYYCLDTSVVEAGECPVVAVNIGDLDGQKLRVYDDFVQFVLDLASEEI